MKYTIYPYKIQSKQLVNVYNHALVFSSQWVFDDQMYGLEKEALVSGTDKVLDHAVAMFKLPKKFSLTFSNEPIDSYQIVGDWESNGSNSGSYISMGNWYKWTLSNGSTVKVIRGWLCPALYNYFSTPPNKIYIKVEAVNETYLLL